jgi:hypothetical protein
MPTATPTLEPPTATPDLSPYRIVRSGRSVDSAGADLTFDGDPSTARITSAAGEPPEDGYFSVDLGSTKAIGTVRWLFGVEGAADQWQLQVSTDRRNWSTVADLGNAAAGDWQSIEVSAKARYVRFFFLNPNGDAQIGGVAEIEVLP